MINNSLICLINKVIILYLIYDQIDHSIYLSHYRSKNLVKEERYEHPQRHSRRSDIYSDICYDNQGEVLPPNYSEDDKEQHYVIMKDS